MERESAKAGVAMVRETPPPAVGYGPGRGKADPAVVLLGLRLSDPAEIIKRVEEGFSFQALERFQKVTRIPTDDLAEVYFRPPGQYLNDPDTLLAVIRRRLAPSTTA